METNEINSLEKAQRMCFDSAVEYELKRAAILHDGAFASRHEKYAVLLEEFEELKREIETTDGMIDALWRSIKEDDDECYIANVRALSDQMKYVFAETIHTAAMAEKVVRNE